MLGLYWLDCVSFDGDLNGLLKQIHRDDKFVPALTRGQDTFDALKRASANPDFLTNLDESAGGYWEFLSENRLYALNL